MNPQLREMMERYLAGDLSEIEMEAFLTLIRNDTEALAELKQVMLQQAMLHDLLHRPREQVRKGSHGMPVAGTSGLRPASVNRARLRAAASPGSSNRLRAESVRGSSVRRTSVTAEFRGSNRWQWGVAAAAILIITLGLIALWVNVSTDRDAAVAERQAIRRQAILRQLAELEKEAVAARSHPERPALLETVKPLPPRPQPKAPAETAGPSDAEALRHAELAQGRREADEAAQLIEARRQQLMAQLKRFPTRRSRGDDTDEEAEPGGVRQAGDVEVASSPAGEADVHVGRVVFVGDGPQSGVVVRGDAREEVRFGLRTGLKLKRGDRVETAGSNAPACAVVEMASGATLDLDQKTVVEVLDRDEARLSVGRIYAAVPRRDEDSDSASVVPFSLQTRTGRYLTQEVRAEIFASPEFTTPRTSARIDNGKLHLINAKGVIAGYKGQEIQSQGCMAPRRSDAFSAPIWRGRDRPTVDLPFTKGNLLIYTNENPTKWFSEDYAMLLAHRGEIRLVGLQVSQGNENHEKQFQLLARETQTLSLMGLRNLFQPAMGVPRPLFKPRSEKLEETKTESSAAVMQILAGARVASVERPLVIVSTGALTDVASAWLLDRGIAERVVVVGPFAGSGIEWSFDPWAAELVLGHFRCVLGGGPGLVLDQARLSRMADSRWTKFAGKATGGDPEFCKLGFVTIPGLITRTMRARFTGVVLGQPKFEPDPQGRIWLVKKTDAGALLREFDQTFLRPGR